MNRLKLIEPTKEYEDQVMAYREILIKNGESADGCAALEETETYDEWLDFENRLKKKYGKGYTPSTVCLAVRTSDNKLIGIIDFRHDLTDFLKKYGGNIGYSVLPSERQKGYAKEMLGLMLNKCRAMGKDKVLITCDKGNIASSKTIIANGGVLENEVPDEASLGKSGVVQRYWIYFRS